MKIKAILFLLLIFCLSSCGPAAATPAPTLIPSLVPTLPATLPPTVETTATAAPRPAVPHFSHIVVIVLENREYTSVIGSPSMPNFNRWADEYTLLEQHYAIRHPSLPNYLALIGGDTFKIDSDCENCFVNAPSLPDLLEQAGMTWKAYQEDMPAPCYLGSTLRYAQKHDPFVYFDPIRLDKARCESHVVPLTQLDEDLKNSTLPDFIFITPNICNDAHDCDTSVADAWLGNMVPRLLSDPSMAADGLIVLTWDEGQGDHSCCGLTTGGGRIATVLISPLAKAGFVDHTPYTIYSLLKTFSAAWNLPLLGHAADPQTTLITAPWK